MLHEQPYDCHVTPLGREVERHRIVAFIPDVRVRPALQQQTHDRLVRDSVMQRRAQARMTRDHRSLVDDVRMRVEQRRSSLRITAHARLQQRRDGIRTRVATARALPYDDFPLQIAPARKSVLACQRVLHLTQRRFCGWLGMVLLET